MAYYVLLHRTIGSQIGAKILRNKIVEDSQIQEINDFSNFMIFDSADQQTMILMLSKNKSESYNFKYSKVLSQDFSKKINVFFQ